MARRRRPERRKPQPDSKYNSIVLAKMINQIMERGKKSVAKKIVYDALDELGRLSKQDPLIVFEQALNNVKPRLEVKSRRVGGATYQVPLEVSPDRQNTLAMRWVIGYSKSKKGVPMGRALAMELMDAYNQTGSSIKKREDTHKMAQANKAFAHYRW